MPLIHGHVLLLQALVGRRRRFHRQDWYRVRTLQFSGFNGLEQHDALSLLQLRTEILQLRRILLDRIREK